MENEKKLKSFGPMMDFIFVSVALILVYKGASVVAGISATIGVGFLLAGLWKPLSLAAILGHHPT